MKNISNPWDSSVCEEKKFTSSITFAKELQGLLTGVYWIMVVDGYCHMRPEIRPEGNCTVLIRKLCTTVGFYKTYKYVFEEVAYEPLCFS